MAFSIANKAASRAKFNINKYGRFLRVRRKKEVMGGDEHTIVRIKFLPQPLTAEQVKKLIMEGNYNAANSNAVNFVCAGDVHVEKDDQGPREGDEVEYRGFWHPLGNTPPTEIGDVVIMRECVGTRGEVSDGV